MVHDWGDKVDYGIGLSYLAGQAMTTLCHRRLYPPVKAMATVLFTMKFHLMGGAACEGS
jgi:phosphoglycerate-specific signal transduction histidine kinase